MDTHALEVFVAVADANSFSLAAERLHLTQPAVSKRIAALEQQLDCPLFDRIGRRIQLTGAGQALLPRARRILQDVSAAQHAIRDLRGSVSGHLSLAISHHIGLHRIPPVLRTFSQKYPQVRLDIEFMDSEQAYEKIQRGELELAVVTLAPGDTSALHSTLLWPDPLHLVARPDHPLALRTPRSLRALCKYPVILPSFSTYTGQLAKAFFDRHQLVLDVAMATHYLETIKAMVATGLGWSVLPGTLIDQQQLVSIDLADFQVQRSLGYVYHQDRSLSNAARAFIQALRDSAGLDGADPGIDD